MFAFGETLLQPTIPALVNDLAPDHLRGRYNALSSGAFQLAAVIAPPISGVLIGHALGEVYIGLLIVGCLLCGLVAIARLEPQPRPAGQRRPLTRRLWPSSMTLTSRPRRRRSTGQRTAQHRDQDHDHQR